jgi:aspartate aminotransferase
MAVANRVRELAAQGRDVVGLQTGDPDFVTPAHIIEAGHAALLAGDTHYPPARGTKALLEAIAAKLERENGLRYAPLSEVLVTCGAQEAISVIMQTLLDPGDEVLLPDPFYTAYEMAIGLAHGKVVHVPTYAEQDFEVQPAAICHKIWVSIVASVLNEVSGNRERAFPFAFRCFVGNFQRNISFSSA